MYKEDRKMSSRNHDVYQNSFHASLQSEATDFVENQVGYSKCPQGNSNPRFGLERATSLAARRWGQSAFILS